MLIIVASVGGASDREIHEVVQAESETFGYHLRERDNYLETNAPAPPFAYARPGWAEEFRDDILGLGLARRHGRNRAKLSLLLVGKSLGAIEIWNSLRLQWSYFDDFHRIAAVLIDPHGAVEDDEQTGPYCDRRDLWWPSNWPTNTDFFRVYHIFQQNQWGSPESGRMINLTGANFPDRRVYRSEKLVEPGVNHKNIPECNKSRDMIRSALEFACLPRGEAVPKPFGINVRNMKGRNSVDGAKAIDFQLENLKCDCYHADVQVFKDGLLLTTLHDVQENKDTKYLSPTPGRRITLKATCGRQTAEQTVNLDYESPTLGGIEVAPVRGRENSRVVFADPISDDGYWNPSDYRIEVVLDRTERHGGSGTSITLDNLSEGQHSVTMRIGDGFGRWSDTRSTSFAVSGTPVTFGFIEPRENTVVHYGANINIAIEAGHATGIMRVKIYLDRISDDEFDFTQLCSIPGRFGVGQAERKTCPRVSVVSSGVLEWRPGMHKLIGVAVDYSGNETVIERHIRIVR